MKIVMVLTSHDQLGNTGLKTGIWLEEFAAPYYVFHTSYGASEGIMRSYDREHEAHAEGAKINHVRI